MKKLNLLTTALVAATISFSTAYAEQEMEKCHVVDADGHSIIKADKADGTEDNAAWIMVPKGECEKINKGDFSGVSEEIKEKIEGAH